MAEKCCLICNRDLILEECSNVLRGIQTLINTSIERNDRLHEKLKNRNEITLHTKCREKYTLKRRSSFCYKDFGTDLAKKSQFVVHKKPN